VRNARLFGQGSAGQRGIRFEFEGDSGTPARAEDTTVQVYGDACLLSQAVTNLLSNAIKFTPQGGCVTFRSSVRMAPSEETPECLVVFEVEDSGCGIAKEDIPRVLEPFGQVRTGNNQHGGTGLGLPLAKDMVEIAHGGEFLLTSEQGKGTKVQVTLRLPWRQTCAPSAVCYPILPELEPLRRLAQTPPSELAADMLVVDDMTTVTHVCAHACKKARLTFAKASDGTEAIALIKGEATGVATAEATGEATGAPLRKFGVVVLDMQMRVMNGDTACVELRKLGYDGVLVLHSGDALDLPEQQRLRKLGFDMFIVKGGTPGFNDLVKACCAIRHPAPPSEDTTQQSS
jgi:CheY-like chemotaxis protein